ncbi:unnamed protein product [Phytophthora fragariaefolia]|uniref:Unnamed protein product n=1 Tax=Phytophthora fragariaefolia TaxID=1490495 RepID=A0A9W6XDF1_9STRA|nr:unnamed protein product [Phytophthora fragariaefolia]
MQSVDLHLPDSQEARRWCRVRHSTGIAVGQRPHVAAVRLYGGELVSDLLGLCVGDVAALLYLAVYWRHTTEGRYVGRVLAVVFSILAVATIYAIVSGFGYLGQTRAQVGSALGLICDAVAVCLYGAPMEKLFHVLKYRSAVFINVHMVIAGLSNNCTWITYGILTSNWFIISPNILFITLNSSTLVLYLVFNPETHPLPDHFYRTTTPDRVESMISIELSPKESLGRKIGSELPSPAYEAMASPLGALPW